jgi:hypothetical protein
VRIGRGVFSLVDGDGDVEDLVAALGVFGRNVVDLAPALGLAPPGVVAVASREDRAICLQVGGSRSSLNSGDEESMQKVFGVALVIVVMVLTGCTTITLLSAPAVVAAGDIARFVLEVSGGPGDNTRLHVVAEVPESWDLTSSTYQGTIGGVPVTGTGSVVPQAYSNCTAMVRQGFKQVWIADGPFTTNSTDAAEVTLEFQANEVPDGEIIVRFWFISAENASHSCEVRPAVATINRGSHQLSYGKTVTDGSLYDNTSMSVTPGGAYLVIGGGYLPELALFSRTESTGELEFVDIMDHPDVRALSDITIGPEGRTVYGAMPQGSKLVVYSLGPRPGTATLVQSVRDDVDGVHGLSGARAVVVSPDGTSAWIRSVGLCHRGLLEGP